MSYNCRSTQQQTKPASACSRCRTPSRPPSCNRCRSIKETKPNCCSCGRQVKSEATKKVPVIWVLGGPGSGKGTQCEKIVQKYGFTHLSTGDLLRNEVSSGSSRGKELQSIMEQGKLVPNDIMIGLLKEAIKGNVATAKGFLIDGYPREKEQGALFEESIVPVDIILYFEAADSTLVDRLLGRAVASGRADDNEATIKLRIQTFKENNDKVLNQYTHKLKRINAERPVDAIFEEVVGILDPLVA